MYSFYMRSKDGEFTAFQSEDMKFCCEWLDCHVHTDVNTKAIRYGDESHVVAIDPKKNAVVCGEYDKPYSLTVKPELKQSERSIMASNLRNIRQRIHEHCLGNYMAPVLEAIAILEYQFGLYNY